MVIFRKPKYLNYKWGVLKAVLLGRGSSVSVVTKLRAGRPGFDSRAAHIFWATKENKNLRIDLLSVNFDIANPLDLEETLSCVFLQKHVSVGLVTLRFIGKLFCKLAIHLTWPHFVAAMAPAIWTQLGNWSLSYTLPVKGKGKYPCA
jgi:hypothetical protein